MSEFTPLMKSSPSARVRQILNSAQLDVPHLGGKERALAAVSLHSQRAMTTNFSGIALGTTVHRLIGAVTLYGSSASPWRLVVRGTFVGAAAGAMALAAVVTLRWVHGPDSTLAGRSASPTTPMANSSLERTSPESNSASPSESLARSFALLRGAAIELDSARPEAALASIETLLQGNPSPKVTSQAIVLKVKALLRLGRLDDAETAAKSLFVAPPSPETHEVRAMIEAHRSAASDRSAK